MDNISFPAYVDMSFIITCCLICISLYYLKKPKLYFRGCILAIIGVLLSFVVVSIWQIVTISDIKLIAIFISPIILGIVIGVGILSKFKVFQFPLFICILSLFGSVSSFVLITGDFLTPIYFNTSQRPKNQLFYLLMVEVCLGMWSSVSGIIGYLVVIFKLLKLLPHYKLRIPLRSFFVVFTLILSIILSSFIILVNDNTAKLALYWTTALLIALCSFITMMVDQSDLSIMMGILQSLSGWTVVAVGLIRNNNTVVFCGSIVGMYFIVTLLDSCQAKKISLLSMIFANKLTSNDVDFLKRKIDIPQIDLKEVSEMCLDAQNIVIIPSHSLIQSHSQILLNDLVELLKQKNKNVKIAIHPTIELMRGFIEILMVIGHIDSTTFCSFEINNSFLDVDLVLICGDCRMTPYSKANWKKFETTKALHSIVLSEIQLVEQNEQNVYWCHSPLYTGFETLINNLRHNNY
ncbi:NAD(P) transhydrogenase subunit beta, putative [Entamoeba dispar SAW760]|uniref:proton-translocating NAD(P)(+) transhydrogenase n=1 Tax=Entamoeba dispar (strain ATCC PRA-260 / SAW760) TaxID=370354 RepID=B0EIG8_ENTDS|nr:NAD(P) transhydrogenase subunit beta, putative [Entamoeba dispar SAW760]EDR25697.1 NAD(P) transhydrogenase subunit beta, putative [Entamoeba dispar SAW760]|eukprot:EDR25697.1 NAD(P) transhydrogenase subunit beta, putative [Entamoeba dispar SAW760]